ncbi:asparagine synthase-related protein [Desulfuromonas versatilis]|uniref:asparagine synthase-related protein n=1 Tax=Desulfuromonas versatilis TaxID=2802975 RepID=UPI001C86167C|nr:asparagine synthase-related protein [Desulfuromonas versatilis]
MTKEEREKCLQKNGGSWRPCMPFELNMSPYCGTINFEDFDVARSDSEIDLISIADLLRNGFVYPPHSVYRNLKIHTFGFDKNQNQHTNPSYKFPFYNGFSRAPKAIGSIDSFISEYHRLLCAGVRVSSEKMNHPWLLQSGGKDSTSMAIAVSEVRPDTSCITYLGGPEEDEVASAREVANRLGLHHEALVCNPSRAYESYLSLVGRMPLLTADFALLSYADLLTQIDVGNGDGVLDGLGSDVYFGTPVRLQQRVLNALALGVRLPPSIFDWGLVRRRFKLCYVLSTLQMKSFERFYPGSRFSNEEVDEILGQPHAERSSQRLELFRAEIDRAGTSADRRALAVSVFEASGAFAKGLFTASALGMKISFPFCNLHLAEWVFHNVPQSLRVDPKTHCGKVLVREHIRKVFEELPYVSNKGSFRFDLCGLARQCYDQVHSFACDGRDIMPGAVGWLERNRFNFNNKYFASKFYLLAVVLPWLIERNKKNKLLKSS